MAAVPEIDQIREILNWIGFAVDAQRTSIINDAFSVYADIQSLTEKDITDFLKIIRVSTLLNPNDNNSTCEIHVKRSVKRGALK